MYYAVGLGTNQSAANPPTPAPTTQSNPHVYVFHASARSSIRPWQFFAPELAIFTAWSLAILLVMYRRNVRKAFEEINLKS